MIVFGGYECLGRLRSTCDGSCIGPGIFFHRSEGERRRYRITPATLVTGDWFVRMAGSRNEGRALGRTRSVGATLPGDLDSGYRCWRTLDDSERMRGRAWWNVSLAIVSVQCLPPPVLSR